MKRIILRCRAAVHEMRCAECRVTWMSWLERLTFTGGMTPSTRKSSVSGSGRG